MAKKVKPVTSETFLPAKATPVNLISDVTVGYIPGVTESPLVAGYRGLPQSIDDAERDFGLDIYDRMCNDPVVAAVINGLKRLCLADGFAIQSACPDLADGADSAQKKIFDECAEICGFITETVDNLDETDRDLLVTLDEMLDSFSHGNRLSEVTWQYCEYGNWKGKLILEGIRPKPRQNFLYVVDESARLLGAMAKLSGGYGALRTGLIGTPATRDNILPKDRLFLMTVNPKNGDPRGRSLLRPAYNPWKRRQIVDPEEVKYLVQFGGGMITAECGSDSSEYEVTLPDGTTRKLKNTEFVTQILSQMGGNGGVGAFPEGTKITVHTGGASGSNAFKFAFDRAAREIVMAVMTTARAIMEAEKSSEKDTNAALDIVKAIVGYWRTVLASAVRRQVFRPLIAANFGDDRARTQAPFINFTAGSVPDFASNASAVSSLISVAPESMHSQIYEKAGIVYKPGKEKPTDENDET